jgi:hypothetical protein
MLTRLILSAEGGEIAALRLFLDLDADFTLFLYYFDGCSCWRAVNDEGDFPGANL